MFNPPPQEVLDQVPRLRANEKAQTSIRDTIIHLHFFIAGCDWWIAEYNGDDMFWGFVNLNDDLCAEWGYVLFSELKSIATSGLAAPIYDAETGEVMAMLPLAMEWDENWVPKPFREVEWRRSKGPALRSPKDEGGRKAGTG